MKTRLLIIGMGILLLLGAVYIVGTTLYEESKLLPPAKTSMTSTPSIPVERGVFERAGKALSYQQMPESKKTLNTYYQNRAYPGAPPSIPHPLVSEKGIGGKTCLQCHQNGGFVKQFNAFAPVTPHPELLNCRQCHVPQKTTGTFKPSNWEKVPAADIHQIAMPGAPPMIPHDLNMRNNCLACHAGPAAPKEIRVTHPERVNCRQCHLPQKTEDIFVKPMPDGTLPNERDRTGSFSRPLDQNELTKLSEYIKKGKQ